MAESADSEEIVKRSLEEFMKTHDPEASLECIDEIVLSYMVQVLEELGSDDATEDDFDVETFTEMMKEYLPSFADIDSIAITEWMFTLASKLNNVPDKDTKSVTSSSLSFPIPPTSQPQSYKRTHSTSEKEAAGSPLQNGLSGKSPPAVTTSPSDPAVLTLQELFPTACRVEVAHCLSVASGDLQRAAQLVLLRQDAGESITEHGHNKKNARKSNVDAAHRNNFVGSGRAVSLNDADMKKTIVNRYAFVDTDDDKRTHKPILPKGEDKKLVRYLDNKVVTLKGERFTEIKKPDDGVDPEKMKKTFVNLKPAKQYRFH